MPDTENLDGAKKPWIKPPSASLEELQQQLQDALAEQAEVDAMVVAARDQFDALGSTYRAYALRAMLTEAERQVLYVERAQRLPAAKGG